MIEISYEYEDEEADKEQEQGAIEDEYEETEDSEDK